MAKATARLWINLMRSFPIHLQRNCHQVLHQLETAISHIRVWMASNHLKLNEGKTEFLMIGKPKVLKNIPITSIKIGDTHVQTVNAAKNIGAILDCEMCMSQHINSTIRSCYSHLRQICHIRPYLTQSATETLINSLITSRLDYMNALLFGLPDSSIHKLQLVQNSAAKVILMKKKRDHVTPLLQGLHWLPIDFRIKYKINLLTYKSLHGKSPQYLIDMIKPYKPARTLRSSSHGRIEENNARYKRTGDRAFSVSAPKLWNALPEHVKNCETLNCFKKTLKTYYFTLAFK